MYPYLTGCKDVYIGVHIFTHQRWRGIFLLSNNKTVASVDFYDREKLLTSDRILTLSFFLTLEEFSVAKVIKLILRGWGMNSVKLVYSFALGAYTKYTESNSSRDSIKLDKNRSVTKQIKDMNVLVWL